jgi:peptide/nickel transport system substrate-binding protein
VSKKITFDPAGAGASDPFALSRRSALRLALAGGALAMMPGAFAQGTTSKRGGTLSIGADADPIGLDPATLTAFSSFDFTSLIYSGLLRWTPDMKIETDLATSYEQPDATTYVFKLRQGVKFHNGQDFTADDVKYTFDRILGDGSTSRLKALYSNVSSVTVIDPFTVQFKLATTDAAFLNYLASNPDGTIAPRGVQGLAEHPIGTGPFVFESYTPNQQFTLKAFKDYYEEGQPYLDTVIFKFYKDQATLTSALRSKAIDMTWLKDPRVAAQVAKTSPDLISAPGQTSRTFPVWLNMKAKPFDDVRVRRALSLATDRAACVASVLGGSGKVGAMLAESYVGGYDGVSELPYYKYDPAAAKALLAEAGYKDGIDLGEYIVVAANPLDVACAQLLQQQWATAGIKVAINPMETAPLLQMSAQGTFATLLSVAQSWSPDADSILSRMSSDHVNGKAWGMHDDELDALIKASRADINPETRAEKHQKIQRIIADNAYHLMIYQYPLRWELWWNYVEGYHALAANIRSYVRTTWRDA